MAKKTMVIFIILLSSLLMFVSCEKFTTSKGSRSSTESESTFTTSGKTFYKFYEKSS